MANVEAQELGDRLSRIRLPVAEAARRAEVNQHTIGRDLSGRGRMSDRTRREVVRALVNEEVDLLDHLLRLHPQAARERLPALAA